MNERRRLIKMECRKAILNKYFYITFGVALLLAVLSAWYMIEVYISDLIHTELYFTDANPWTGYFGLYNAWIGGEWRTLGYTLFFTLLPLMAAFPYGWSQSREKASGYTKNVVIRGGKRDYYLAKYLATFLSGGLVILVPLIVNFTLVACFIPAYKPSLIYVIYYGISAGTLWSKIFYTCPLIFCVLYMLLDFVFAGLFACLSYGFANVVKNSVVVVLIPFFVTLGLHYAQFLRIIKIPSEISPIYYLHSIPGGNNVHAITLLIEGLLFFGIALILIIKGAKDEIY